MKCFHFSSDESVKVASIFSFETSHFWLGLGIFLSFFPHRNEKEATFKTVVFSKLCSLSEFLVYSFTYAGNNIWIMWNHFCWNYSRDMEQAHRAFRYKVIESIMQIYGVCPLCLSQVIYIWIVTLVWGLIFIWGYMEAGCLPAFLYGTLTFLHVSTAEALFQL